MASAQRVAGASSREAVRRNDVVPFAQPSRPPARDKLRQPQQQPARASAEKLQRANAPAATTPGAAAAAVPAALGQRAAAAAPGGRAAAAAATASTSTIGTAPPAAIEARVAVGDVCAKPALGPPDGGGGGGGNDTARSAAGEAACRWFAATLRSALEIRERSVPAAPGSSSAFASTAATVYATLARVAVVAKSDANLDEDESEYSATGWRRRAFYDGVASDDPDYEPYESVRHTATDDEDDPADADDARSVGRTHVGGAGDTGRDSDSVYAQRPLLFGRASATAPSDRGRRW